MSLTTTGYFAAQPRRTGLENVGALFSVLPLLTDYRKNNHLRSGQYTQGHIG